MAGYKILYLSNLILNLEDGGVAWTPPATWYLALYTTMPSSGGTGGIEVSGGGYARIAMTNDLTTFATAVGGAKTNAIPIACGTPSSNWGTIAGAVKTDSATIGAGNMYRAYLATPQISAPSGTPVVIPIGALISTEA